MAKDASVRNVEDLKVFSRNLTTAAQNLTTLFQRLRTQMHKVCEGWNDDKNRQFMADFEVKVRDINKMSQEMEVYAQFLKKTCAILDQYKSLR